MSALLSNPKSFSVNNKIAVLWGIVSRMLIYGLLRFSVNIYWQKRNFNLQDYDRENKGRH